MCMCSCSYSCSCVSIYPPIHPSIHLSIYLSVYLPAWKREAILRDFLSFRSRQHEKRSKAARLPEAWTWHHQKRNKSARLAQFSKLTTSKTKQFYVPMRFAFFPFHLSKVLHLSRKIILANLKIWCSKMQPLRKSARWPPNISDEHVSCTAPATRNSTLQILFKSPMPANVFETAWNCYKILRFYMVLSTFGRVQNPLRLPHKIMQRLKMVLAWPVVFLAFSCIFTLTCALRHSGVHCFNISTSRGAFYILTSESAVHFFDISTSKSAPRMVRFVHFDFHICFAPQRRALFRHLNFEKWSEPECFQRFDFQICFAPQWRAIFHLSSDQMAPRPPL